jgi:hypothetical protein
VYVLSLGRRNLGVLFVLLALGLLLINVKSLPAMVGPIITPPTPTAGQTFTVSGTMLNPPVGVDLYPNPGCVGAVYTVLGYPSAFAPYSFTVVGGEPVGSYSVGSSYLGCTNFTVTPAAPAHEGPSLAQAARECKPYRGCDPNSG